MMKRLLSLFGLFVLLPGSWELRAQSWENVNDPYDTRRIYHATAHDSTLWLLDDGDAFTGAPSTSLRLKSLKAGTWDAFPEYIPAGMDSLHGIRVVGSGTYLYVGAATYTGGVEKALLLRFSMTSETWSEVVPINDKLITGSRIHTIAVYANELYVAGTLPDATGANQLLCYRPQFNAGYAVTTVAGEVDQMAAYPGALYIGGTYDSIDAKPIKNLSFYNGSSFVNYSGVGSKPGLLKTLGTSDLVYFEETVSQQNYLNLLSSVNNDQVLNNNFPGNFVAGDVERLWGQYYVIQTASLEGIFSPGIYHLNGKTGQWERTKSALDPQQSVFVNTGSRIYLVELSSNGVHLQEMSMARLSGRVFVDIDGDCAKTMGDRYLGQMVLVHDQENEIYLEASEPYGAFGAFVNSGTFHLEVPNIPQRLSDNVCAWNDSFILSSGDSVKVDIPLSVIDTTASVRVKLVAAAGYRARQGFEEYYELIIYNEGFRFTNCPVTVSFPEYLQFTGADIMPNDSNGGKYTWNVNVAPFQKMVIPFRARVYVFAPSETKLRLTAWSDPACLRYNNTDSLMLRVVGAFDPNDKQSTPEGNIPLGTEFIEYHIRFQNTGTDTAINVYIIDTLDYNLPMRFLQVVGAKPGHNYKVYVDVASGEQRFQFDNIMLPDSSTDFEGSQGFFKYRAKLSTSMKAGDSLKNTAYIFFDYQKPVQTNTVKSKLIQEPDRLVPIAGPDDKFLVYPNPAATEVNVVNFTNESTPCVLYAMDGKVLASRTLQANEEAVFFLEGMSPGVYFVRFPEWNMQEILVITQKP